MFKGINNNSTMWEALKKFGLAYSDLPTMLSNVTAMFRFLALDVDPRKKPVSMWRYILLLFTSACYYYIYLISMIWFVFWRCQETGDLFSAIIVFSLGVSSEISMTKLICMFVQRKNVRKLISAFLDCDARVDTSSRLAANLKPTLRAAKKRAIIVWSVIIWNGIVYVLIPLLRSERHFMDEVFEFYGFGNMENMKRSPNYEIAFFINMIGVYVTCFPAGNVTAFFIIISGYVEANMLALSIELTNLWDDALRHCHETRTIRQSNNQFRNGCNNGEVSVAYTASSIINISITASECQDFSDLNKSLKENYSNFATENINQNKERNEFIRKRLESIAKSHTEMIHLRRLIEGIYRIPLAIEFILLIMGLIAELLGGLEKTYIELPFAMISVGVDCLTGQRIKDASMTFLAAVYDSKWENFDVGNRKMILMMLRSSQKEMKLSAGGVATLSFECLMSICRMTYSAYTTLRSTMK